MTEEDTMGDTADQLAGLLPGDDDYATRLMELYEPVEQLYSEALLSTQPTVSSCPSANLNGC